MNLFVRLNSVRGRLLALMLFILAPIAMLSMVLATTTYRSVSQAIELAQLEIASNYAVRVRIWFRGALRSTLALASAAHSAGLDDRRCSAALRDVADAIHGIQAVSLRMPGVSACHHSLIAGVDAAALDRLRETQAARPSVQLWAGPELGQSRYDVVRIAGAAHLVIYTRLAADGAPDHELIALMDVKLLDAAFDIGALDRGVVVALMNRGQQVIAARGADEAERDWLPRAETFGPDVTRTTDQDGSGVRRSYATQMVSAPDMYVLARFDGGPARAAFFQFLIMALTPLLTLAVLFLAYMRAIDSDILRWMRAIEAAARERLAGGFRRVTLDPAMPDELRSVAGAHNGLLDDVERRERDLEGSLARNIELRRELNHHLKNSLQVIQSYLALSRRENPQGQEGRTLETEAKVLVLSSAYRLALQDGSLQPVPLKPFIEEIVAMLSAHARGEGQWIDARVTPDIFPLVVDRAIPLGLAVVEAVGAALAARRSTLVTVVMELEGEDAALLSVACDGAPLEDRPPRRIMQGLATQIGARSDPAAEGQLLRWRIGR